MNPRRITIEPEVGTDFLTVKLWRDNADAPLEVWETVDTTTITRSSMDDAASKIKKLWGLLG